MIVVNDQDWVFLLYYLLVQKVGTDRCDIARDVSERSAWKQSSRLRISSVDLKLLAAGSQTIRMSGALSSRLTEKRPTQPTSSY